jgi:acyl-CoA reductase-like NAD-dependent aldehyde dehydrogenase
MSESDSVLRLRNFINNQYVDTDSYVDSYNPSNGKLLAKIPNSGKSEAEAAVNAALEAFKKWSKTTPAERSVYLNRIADEIEKRLDEFAVAESLDQGKPLTLSKNSEIPRAIHNFRFFATAILHHKDESTANSQAKVFNYTTRVPNGVAVLISPWNLPLYLLSWKIAPCIASGCTCICKPSEFTSNTAYMLCECILMAGLPPG